MTRGFILSAILFFPLCESAPAQTPKPSKLLADYSAAVEELARSVSPAVVQILVQTLSPIDKGDAQRLGFVSEQQATGSGVIVDPAGYIVTNAHVIENARRIEVRILRSDEKGQEPHSHILPAKLIGMDRLADIAIVKIDGGDLPSLSFRDSDTLRQGQLVLAVGSPLGLQNSISHCVVSAIYRQLKPDVPLVYIQTDAPINPGNSGGPLLDVNGQIAGINTMIYTQSGGNEGIGFAIPSNIAKDIYLKLRKDGRIRRGAIGIIPETITPTLGTALGLDRDSGVILSDVMQHSAAEVAGLEPGDVVLSVDGKSMRDARDLGLAIFQHAPGDQIAVEIQRGTVRQTIKVAVLEQDNQPGRLGDLANSDATLIRELGILAVTLDEKVTPILPDLRRLSGVVVVAVPAEYEGLNPGLIAGDVIYSLNNVRVASLADLQNALKEKKTGDPIALLVERNTQLIYVTAVLE